MFHRSREQGAGSGRTRRALLPALSSLLLVSFGCSRDHCTPLVIYSPHGRDLLTLFERRFEALHPDIDVRWLDMGSQDVYDRLRSEKAKDRKSTRLNSSHDQSSYAVFCLKKKN